MRNEQGDKHGAERDFLRSEQLMPTTIAEYELGLFAMEHGRSQEAISYFRKAAVDDSRIGETARLHLARLDLSNNPGRYIDATVARDADGYLHVIVENTAPVTVTEIRIEVGKWRVDELPALGLRKQRSYDLGRTLAPGQRVYVRTDFGQVRADKVRKYGAEVVRAVVVD